MLFSVSIKAQETKEKVPEKKESKEKILEEEEGPFMFKFEPDFEDQQSKKKAIIALTRSIIDTLDISERKRLKLLRDLYKNGVSKRLEKAILVETTFEEDGDN